MDELDLGWQIIKGNKPILIVAGHNFAQGRKGKIKHADLGTGSIARNLCDKFGFWGIISTKDQMDPNWYPDSTFREKVKELIKKESIETVLDIHGRKLGYPTLIELIGNKNFKTKYGCKIKQEIHDCLEDEQLTLTEEIENMNIPSLILEIREDGRISTINENNYRKAQNIINNLIKTLNES